MSTSDTTSDLGWLADAGKVASLTVTAVSEPPESGSGQTAASPSGVGAIKLGAPGAAPVRLLDRYQVLDTLGEGGMGVVYLAREDNLRRSVALKLARVDDEESLRRFVLEAQVTAQLDHPGIVPVYALEVARDGGLAYTMKRIEGTTLEDALAELRARYEREGRSPAVRARQTALLESLMRVCEAVSFAHGRRITHRDLKPSNIMLGSCHEVYVVDWGLAKVGPADPQGDAPGAAPDPDALAADRSHAGAIKGTPRYMAPEQALARPDQIGPASDVYALGMILHELLYLQPARRGLNLMAALAEARANRLEPPPPGLRASPELVAIVARATAAEPGQRYASAADLAADLRAVLRNEETTVLPDRGWRRLRRWISNHPHLATSGAVALVALLVGGWVAMGVHYEREEARLRLADRVREDALRELTATTSGQARSLAIRLLEHTGHTQAIAAATEAVLEADLPGDRPLFPPSAFATLEGAPPGSAASAHYGGRIICPRALVATVSSKDATRDLALLSRLYGQLRAPFERQGQTPDEVDRSIVAHGVPLEWTYVALERSGAIVLFPGTQGWSLDYDARQRTWYRAAMEAYAARRDPQTWTRPYEDTLGQGLVVTCCHVVQGPSGPAGVAAVDISLQRLIGELDVLSGKLPGFRRAVLVDDEGTSLVSTGAARHALARHPEADRLRAAEGTDGWFRSGDQLLAWSRLPRLRWTLVVEVDEAGLLAAHAGP